MLVVFFMLVAKAGWNFGNGKRSCQRAFWKCIIKRVSEQAGVQHKFERDVAKVRKLAFIIMRSLLFLLSLSLPLIVQSSVSVPGEITSCSG